MMAENILVSFPSATGHESDFSIKNPEDALRVCEWMERNKITSVNNPNIVDVFSGQQGELAPFIKAGWNPGNITCIDKDWPPEPIAKTTLTWNLKALHTALRNKEQLPKSVKKYQGRFDIFLAFSAEKTISFEDISNMFGGFYSGEFLAELAGFFLKQGGIAYLDYHSPVPEKKWQKLEDSQLYIKK